MAAPAATRARLESVCPFFIVKDLEVSLAFYVDQLGFKINLRGFELKDADGYVLYFGRLAAEGDPPVPA